ncbi:MAG: ABC transporter permease [Betaproteobacteria bacterium]|nr:ABC transporter permease [Betaproteobacteria bacterium]
MPVMLWTDALVWFLMATVIVFILYARRREHLSAPWRRVLTSSAAMASAVTLGGFLCIGLIDSIHYRESLGAVKGDGKQAYAVEVLSGLDWMLSDLRKRQEKTYSAPFALHLFQKESLERPDGKIVRVYPRLHHAGKHLQDENELTGDIAWRFASGIVSGSAVAIALVMLGICWIARHAAAPYGAMLTAIMSGATQVRWRPAFLALWVLLIGVGLAASLAPHYHVLGTDKVGQDVLYQALKSIRTALVIGTITTLVTLPLGVLLGIAAGYFKGWIDDIITYVYTTINSIPSVLLIAASVLLMQGYIERNAELFQTTAERADIRLLLLCVILGLTSWTGLARLLRGESLKLRELEYIQAAHALGVTHLRTITRHILPNTMHIVLIALVMEFSSLVLAEAVLSYIGVGVDPTMISFGTMINTARLEMGREPMVWWSLSAAFSFMVILVLAANLFADAVRDAFDPRNAMGRVAAGGTKA